MNYWSAALNNRSPPLSGALPLTGAAKTCVSAWDDEIAAIRTILATAQTQRNSLVPCSSLPSEILSRVFECLAFLEPISSSHYSLREKLGWTVITQVCRFWRDVAVGHGILWADLPKDLEQLWPMFLERAGSSLLSVSINVYPPRVQSTPLSLIADHLHHIGTLRLATGNADVITSLLSSTSPASTLQELDLSISPTYRLSDVIIIISPDFLEAAGNLRILRLRGLHLPWSADLVNLRVLEVGGRDGRLDPYHREEALSESIEVDVNDVLNCIRRLPRLEILSLSRLATTNSTAFEGHIHLPHLMSVSLAGVFQSCLDIWRPIRPNPNSSISITGDETNASEVQVQDAASSLSTHAHTPGCPPFTAVQGRLYTIGGINFTVTSSAKPSSAASISLDFRAMDEQAAVRALCMSVPLSHIHDLYLEGIHSWIREDLDSLLIAAKSLEMLRIERVSAEVMASLCSTLVSPAPKKGGPRSRKKGKRATRQNMAASHNPHLKLLELTEINFDAVIRVLGKTVFTYLSDMLKARKQAGCAPETLDIRDCTLADEQIENLRKLVPKLEWDGGHGVYDDDDEDDFDYGFGYDDDLYGPYDDENDEDISLSGRSEVFTRLFRGYYFD
ncbi:hypothetical protein K488DRAFT_74894 [Vararia minispora EC-137]|uniref:Uncharacterized protein n=1 Tax=Vararia minispora EC-137 TaxID=1314806 RepID=A0ACB8Q6L0_9AGAM|nr:hypothetical protein K488DRAFT_74894 [Vararia minispora EC-137]